MRPINLKEYERSGPEQLSVAERDALKAAAPSVTVEPAEGEEDAYHLTPGAAVGALDMGGLSVIIRPKLEVSRVLYLASYAMGAFKLRDDPFAFAEAPDLVAALAPAFVRAAQRAFGRGLLHGYRTQEETLHTVRGRIAFAEQIRRRFDAPLPVEVRYDDFTDDILANQLVKAAGARLGAMRIADRESRDGLRWIDATLANVSLVAFRPSDVPSVEFDRLNAHYREVVELSRLILRHATFESERGGVRASGFLIDMNVVFQEFVTRALREELGLDAHAFPADTGLRGRMPTLDEGGDISLGPDLSWWEGGDCVFVGDAKYKRTENNRATNADLYQALAYATAVDLPGATLIYAKGEIDPVERRVRHAGKLLEVIAVDLSGEIEDLRTSIATLATHVRSRKRSPQHQRSRHAA